MNEGNSSAIPCSLVNTEVLMLRRQMPVLKSKRKILPPALSLENSYWENPPHRFLSDAKESRIQSFGNSLMIYMQYERVER